MLDSRGFVALRDVCEVNPSRKDLVDVTDETDVSFVPMAAVSEDGKLLEVKTRKAKDVRKGFPHFKEKDVLVAKITPCFENGKRWLANSLVNGIGFGSTEFHVIRAGEKVLPEWIYYCISSSEFRRLGERQMTGTAGQKRVPTSFLEEYEIPIPSILVQEKIVRILRKAEGLKQIREQTNRLASKIIPSIFLKMFGDPSLNSKSWDTADLGELVQFRGGGTPSTDNQVYWNGSIPWVSPKDMKTLLIDDTMDHVSSAAIEERKTKLIPPQTVLMVVRSGILKKHLPLAINSVPAAINQDLKALIPRTPIDPYYLLFHMMIISKDILKTVKGTTADNLSTSILKSTRIIVPSRDLQERFSEIARRVLGIVRTHERTGQEIAMLFDALMNRAFTGKLAVGPDTLIAHSSEA